MVQSYYWTPYVRRLRASSLTRALRGPSGGS